MAAYCVAKCEECSFRENCKGCAATKGAPFGEKCYAAAYIQAGGLEAYRQFKEKTRSEVNALLALNGLPQTDGLYELCGAQVNLEYRLPGGQTVRFLNDNKIYLGAQIEIGGSGICYGVVADASFILVCGYSVDGSEPELVLYSRR